MLCRCYSTTFIICPRDPLKTLGVTLPVVVLYIKNLGKYFSFEIQVRAEAPIRAAQRPRSEPSTPLMP